MINKKNKADVTRQGLNLLAAFFMWTASMWPQMMGYGRSAKAFSDLNDSLLVPFGIAFSIWLPIFGLCAIYSIIQALRANRTRQIFRKTGWWTAIGFICVGLWSLTAYFAPLDIAKWATVLIFIPIVACFLRALYILHQHRRGLDKLEAWLIIVPIALVGGWTSLASFLNLAPLLMFWSDVPDIIINLAVLTAALIFALTMVFKLGRIWSYAFPVIWGLCWLAFKRIVQTDIAPEIGYLAILGVLLIGATLLRLPSKDDIAKPLFTDHNIAAD